MVNLRHQSIVINTQVVKDGEIRAGAQMHLHLVGHVRLGPDACLHVADFLFYPLGCLWGAIRPGEQAPQSRDVGAFVVRFFDDHSII